MSVEPTCEFCHFCDKNRCHDQQTANRCARYIKQMELEAFYDQTFVNSQIAVKALENDFGFTFIDDEPPAETNDLEQQLEDQKKISKKLFNTIEPFLNNLCTNPDKPNIHWPDRVEKIDAFKRKLQAILEGK